MSNHNKIRPVDKNNLNGKYKIVFSTPQSKNSKIPLKFRGLQIFNNKQEAAAREQRYIHWVDPFEPINKNKLGSSQAWRIEKKYEYY